MHGLRLQSTQWKFAGVVFLTTRRETFFWTIYLRHKCFHHSLRMGTLWKIPHYLLPLPLPLLSLAECRNSQSHNALPACTTTTQLVSFSVKKIEVGKVACCFNLISQHTVQLYSIFLMRHVIFTAIPGFIYGTVLHVAITT